MLIRLFRPDDSDALAALFFKTIRQVNIRDYTPEQVAAWAPADRDLEAWRSSFQGKTVFVSEANGQITGFAELEPNGHIDRFYIDADSIGRGVGTALYTKIENEARKLQISKLFVEASITARPFFARMGYTVVKEQTVQLRGVQMGNFVMEKLLPE